MIFKYYGIDWLLFLLVALHIWLLGEQKRSSFLVAMLATICGTIFGMMTGSVATIVMNVTFFFLYLRAYLMWGRQD